MSLKKKPKHPGKYTKDHLVFEVMPVTKVATVLGVDRSQLSDLLNGEAKLSPTMALRLAKKFDVDKEGWLKREKKYDMYIKHKQYEGQLRGRPHNKLTLYQHTSINTRIIEEMKK